MAKINWFRIEIEEFFRRLVYLVEYGEIPTFLVHSYYLKIGLKCKDCENFYWDCSCNECRICGFSKGCFCDKDYKDIPNETLNWILFNLNKIHIERIIYEINIRTLSINEVKSVKKALEKLQKALNEN